MKKDAKTVLDEVQKLLSENGFTLVPDINIKIVPLQVKPETNENNKEDKKVDSEESPKAD